MQHLDNETVAMLYGESQRWRTFKPMLDYADALIEIARAYEESGYDYQATLASTESRIVSQRAALDMWRATSTAKALEFFRVNWSAP